MSQGSWAVAAEAAVGAAKDRPETSAATARSAALRRPRGKKRMVRLCFLSVGGCEFRKAVTEVLFRLRLIAFVVQCSNHRSGSAGGPRAAAAGPASKNFALFVSKCGILTG